MRITVGQFWKWSDTMSPQVVVKWFNNHVVDSYKMFFTDLPCFQFLLYRIVIGRSAPFVLPHLLAEMLGKSCLFYEILPLLVVQLFWLEI